MPSAPPPLPPLAPSSLRFGTLNIGLGFARKHPPILSRCLALALDIIALQEIGDPALTRTTMHQYLFIAAPGPSGHDSGVALLISQDLAPRCRAFKRSSSGRLVGAILELTKGHQLLVVSAYMPTGLDHRSPSDSSVRTAHQLYTEMMTWTQGMQQVVVMGDLNETLTCYDRIPRPPPRLPHHSSSPPIQCLRDEGFRDAYRLLFSSAARQPGFTHIIETASRSSRSRIDYIWTKGATPETHLGIHIDMKLQHLTHHRLLWLELQILHSPIPPCQRVLFHLRLPNLRGGLDPERQEKFALHVEKKVQAQEHQLRTLAQTLTPDSLSSLATHLTSLVHTSAFTCLPLTSAAPYNSKSILRLERQRRDLTRLLNTSSRLLLQGCSLIRSPEWAHLYRHCVKYHSIHWATSPHYQHDNAAWVEETRDHIRCTRRNIRLERRHLMKERAAPFDTNPAAMIHRMMQSDALPSHLYSVIDEHGHLTSNAEELEDVMVKYFESVFSIPPRDTTPLNPPPPSMLFNKPDVQASWYEGLMDEVGEEELIELVADAPLVSAPGRDEVSVGVWKVAIQGSPLLRSMVVELFSTCLLTAIFPAAWKSSVIVPLIKDAQKDRTMGNIRPISLQSCLGKLFSKLLAVRLGRILQQHPILNPAQRGFILGGTTMKCIDELLDAWDWSRATQSELYTIFYDIKQAYDCVQTPVLVRALHRIHLPPPFIHLVANSLSDLFSCIRTIYGHTRQFPVKRSLRQGDPLAPLLFIVLMDALHDGLRVNPFTGVRHGCKLLFPKGEVELASLGYADDTTILTNRLEDLQIQNRWVQYFLRFNEMKLNPNKCELVGRGPDGCPITDDKIALHRITIDDLLLQSLPHNRPIRYLGAHMSFDGDWTAQQNKSRALIMRFTRLVAKFHLTVSEAVYMFNVFLLTRLELALHYVHGPGCSKWIKDCDRILIGSIKHLVSSPLRLSHSAVALTLHLVLPSWIEISVKVSELFLRMNSTSDRWGELGRVVMRNECPSEVSATTPLSRPDVGTRIQRAAYLAVRKLGWQLSLSSLHRADSRHRHLFKETPLDTLPSSEQCSSSSQVQLADGSKIHIAHDIWIGWIASPHQTSVEVDVFTDGSHDLQSGSSAWSLVVRDQWLDSNFDTIPSDEKQLLLSHASGAAASGASITCTQGVYPAELQAIARTLAMLPLDLRVHIHTDSSSSIAAIQSFREQLNERRRLRMPARSILQLIHHLMTRRVSAGGGARLSHIRAHTTSTDIESVGNRLADFHANLARSKSDRSYPLGLQQIPIERCEHHLLIKSQVDGSIVIDDPRLSARLLLKKSALEKWKAKPDLQCFFSGEGVMDLGRVTLRHGTAAQQSTLVHAATNSIHFHWVTHPDASSTLEQHQCAGCLSDLTIRHLVTCPHPASASFRSCLHSEILAIIESVHECKAWCRANGRLDLPHLLRKLFPPPTSDSSEEVIDHTARCLIGAFTQAAGQRSLRSLSIRDQKEGRILMREIRLCCLDNIEQFFSTLNT